MLAEIAVVQGSSLIAPICNSPAFWTAISWPYWRCIEPARTSGTPQEEIQDVILQPGDILLVQGSREQIAAIKETTDFLVLDASVTLPTTNKAPIALLTLAVVVVLAATGIMPIAVSAVAGAVVLVTTRCLNLPARGPRHQPVGLFRGGGQPGAGGTR